MAIYEGILYLDLRTEDLIESHNTYTEQNPLLYSGTSIVRTSV